LYNGVHLEAAGIGGSFMQADDHGHFCDLALRPAVDHVQNIAAYPDPVDFEAAARRGVGHSSLKLVTAEVNAIIDRMRVNVSETDALSKFGSFFFVVFSHGMKYQLNATRFPLGHPSYVPFVREALEAVPLDWDAVVLEQLYVDLARVVCHPPPPA
jgi:hypothetical protein